MSLGKHWQIIGYSTQCWSSSQGRGCVSNLQNLANFVQTLLLESLRASLRPSFFNIFEKTGYLLFYFINVHDLVDFFGAVQILPKKQGRFVRRLRLSLVVWRGSNNYYARYLTVYKLVRWSHLLLEVLMSALTKLFPDVLLLSMQDSWIVVLWGVRYHVLV
jgi:hypothetical protein